MAKPSERTVMFDRIEGTDDIEDKTYSGYTIKKMTVSNDSLVDMVLSFSGVDRTIKANEIWYGDVEITKFSLDANSGAYRIDIEV